MSEGIDDGVVLGIDDGPFEGAVPDTHVSMATGIGDGVSDGDVLGDSDGSILSISEGTLDGDLLVTDDGRTEGEALGMRVGMALG